ncbi:ComEC/Rec2 family competence protein [Cyanobium sp. ATX 6A2]|uniref:ComEC/Rec2 family competence protein n=1 Tax=Cyanobium sp. ATX 6A2 TaxID=2823700 RepID=UPI0021BCF8F0|nr:ComEC/Rec2 family competence protein [Cyanobium sp. ATX 6A2]MCP9886656.1 ComEC/Rec2 family competence protein [Cyanobium sp. ATX 6A2]
MGARQGEGLSGEGLRVKGPRVKGLIWALLLALVLLRAVLVCLQPLTPAAGDPALRLEGERGPVPVRLVGHLLADPRAYASGTGCSVLLQLPVGRSELQFSPCPQPPPRQGWRLAAEGQLRRPRPAPHPLLAGPAERLARRQAASQLQVERFEVIERPDTPVANLRRRLADTLMERAGPERGGVLAALVLGGAVVPLPAEVRELFRAAGLSHALAASGFHLSVLLGAVLPLARRLPRLPRLLLAFGAMGLFVLLAGLQPSVLRAVLMAAIAVLVLECGQRGRPLAILLASALLLLLIWPRWLVEVGFQLSVVATAALVVAAGPLERALRLRLPAWCGGWLAPATAVPLAACLWTLPLQLLHFGVVPLYAIPANLLAAPLLTPLTLGAMLLALFTLLLPPLAALLLPPLAALAGVLLAIVGAVAALPMAQWQLGRPTPLLVTLLAAGLLGLQWPGLARRWRRLAPALVALACGLHLAMLQADQLLLVHQGHRDLLLARHRGRAALVALQADGFSCHQAGQLARGLGVARFDWTLLLDPLPPDPPDCWNGRSGLVLASADGSPPLLPGQRLQSPGLGAEAIAMASRGLWLEVGRRRWLLLPDRQDLWAWRDQPAAASPPDGLWLGFRPGPRERSWLAAEGPEQVWISGEALDGGPAGWRASGRSGSLQQSLS